MGPQHQAIDGQVIDEQDEQDGMGEEDDVQAMDMQAREAQAREMQARDMQARDMQAMENEDTMQM